MCSSRNFPRKGTHSLKWDILPSVCGKPEILPLWVADMDFPSPDFIVDIVRKRSEHPYYGYTCMPGEYFTLLSSWYRNRYNTEVNEKSFLLGPGILPSMAISLRALTEKNDGVLYLPPVYYPFRELIEDNDLAVIEAPLKIDDPCIMSFNWKAMQTAIDKATAEGICTKALLLCSPQNPGGKVWQRKELGELLDFAQKNELYIISDEIHADIITGSKPFVSMADIESSSRRTVILGGPNKTFNIAGLHISHFVIQDDELRKKISKYISASGFSLPNVMSMEAAIAAYSGPHEWLDSLITRIKDNINMTLSILNVPETGMKAYAPEGTYLVWVDASTLIKGKKLSGDRELARLMESEARVKVIAGSVYGKGGEGFIRINVACPSGLLKEALERIKALASSGAAHL